MAVMFFAFFLLVGTIQEGWAFDIKKVPVFGDGQWRFIREDVECKIVQGRPVPWGKTKLYRLKMDPKVVGIATHAFGNPAPFYKEWVRGSQKPFSVARINGKWIRGVIRNPELITDAITSLPIKIVAVFKSPQGESELTLWNEEFPLLEEVKKLSPAQTIHLEEE